MTESRSPLPTATPSTLTTDIMARSSGFLVDLRFREWTSGASLLLEGRYDVSRFHDALFACLEIDLPEPIVASVTSRRAEFLAGRALARTAMRLAGVCAGPTQGQVPIAADRSPVWPPGVNGAISHSHGRCVVAVSTNPHTYVGVDTERLAHDDALDAIVKHALVPEERKQMDRNAAYSASQWATLVFSAKETLYKLLYPTVRQFFGFDAACVTGSVDGGELSLRLLCDLPGGHACGSPFTVSFELDAEHVTTWAAAGLAPTPRQGGQAER
ncbi:MAG: 4'-phosphopantetheinyl transferase superfamily protein [Pseudomonadota bacterium]